MTGTALTLTDDQPLSLSDCRISEPLAKLLLEHGDRQEALEVIASHPALREEVRASLPSLERTLAPAGPDVVQRALNPLVLVFGMGDQARSSLWWKVYYDALAELPAHAVQAAAEAYPSQPGAEWFPKPAALKALALKAAEPAYQAVGRARAVVKQRRAA